MNIWKICQPSSSCIGCDDQEHEIYVSGFNPTFKSLRESLVKSKASCQSPSSSLASGKQSLRKVRKNSENTEPNTAASITRKHTKSYSVKANVKDMHVQERKVNKEITGFQKKFYT